MAIAIVNGGAAHAGAGASTPFKSVTTAPINTTGASLIVATVSFLQGTAVTFSDSAGNSGWTQVGAASFLAGLSTAIYYCASPITSSSHTFSIGSGSVVCYPDIAVIAFSGTLLSSPQDQSATNTATASANFAVGPITPGFNGELIISGIGSDVAAWGSPSVSTLTVTDQTAWSSGAHYGAAIAWFVQPAAGAITPNWNWNGSSIKLSGSVVSFQAASGTAGLYLPSPLTGLGTGGPFFSHPIG